MGETLDQKVEMEGWRERSGKKSKIGSLELGPGSMFRVCLLVERRTRRMLGWVLRMWRSWVTTALPTPPRPGSGVLSVYWKRVVIHGQCAYQGKGDVWYVAKCEGESIV